MHAADLISTDTDGSSRCVFGDAGACCCMQIRWRRTTTRAMKARKRRREGRTRQARLPGNVCGNGDGNMVMSLSSTGRT
jgi:hypothetical protein